MKKATTSATEITTRPWLRALRAEAEERAARLAPLAGAVRPEQRPWSATLDRLEALSQEAA